MMRFLFKDAIEAASHRIAGYAGTFLTTVGMASPDVDTVTAAIPIIVGFAADMILRKVI